jgi:hypothetical protein
MAMKIKKENILNIKNFILNRAVRRATGIPKSIDEIIERIIDWIRVTYWVNKPDMAIIRFILRKKIHILYALLKTGSYIFKIPNKSWSIKIPYSIEIFSEGSSTF